MTALLKEEIEAGEEEALYLTLEEYLEFEEASEIKHEFINGYVQAMAGASGEHNVITSNLLIRLGMQLLGKRCFPYGSDKRLRIDLPGMTWLYYPDLTIDCTGVTARDTTAPTVLFEVTSASTSRGDRGDKLINYLNLPSMRVYVMVDQARPRLNVHRRASDGTWSREVVEGRDATLALPEIECSLALREVYDRVDFPNVDAGQGIRE